jgi:hypothetical protein
LPGINGTKKKRRAAPARHHRFLGLIESFPALAGSFLGLAGSFTGLAGSFTGLAGSFPALAGSFPAADRRPEARLSTSKHHVE